MVLANCPGTDRNPPEAACLPWDGPVDGAASHRPYESLHNRGKHVWLECSTKPELEPEHQNGHLAELAWVLRGC